jgi:hypothetical protein
MSISKMSGAPSGGQAAHLRRARRIAGNIDKLPKLVRGKA